MRGGILIGFPQIVSAGDDEAVADEQGGDRDFADQRRFPGKGQGLLHEVSIEIVVYGHGVEVEVGRRQKASSAGRRVYASTFGVSTAAGVCVEDTWQ